jgi:hypothetical protein
MGVVVEAFFAGEMVQQFPDPIPQTAYGSFGLAAKRPLEFRKRQFDRVA